MSLLYIIVKVYYHTLVWALTINWLLLGLGNLEYVVQYDHCIKALINIISINHWLDASWMIHTEQYMHLHKYLNQCVHRRLTISLMLTSIYKIYFRFIVKESWEFRRSRIIYVMILIPLMLEKIVSIDILCET